MLVGTDEIGIQRFEPMNQPVLLQKVEGPVNRNRSEPASAFGPQLLDEVIRPQGMAAGRHGRKNCSTLVRQANATFAAAPFGLRQEPWECRSMVMPAGMRMKMIVPHGGDIAVIRRNGEIESSFSGLRHVVRAQLSR